MIYIKGEVKDIDYDALLELTMPYLISWMSDQNNKFYSLMTKVISNKGKPNRLSKLIISALPKKTELAVLALPHFDEMLVEYINHIANKNGIVARVSDLKAQTIERNDKKMLRIEFLIDEVDYEKTAEDLLPILLQQLSEKEDSSAKLPKLLLSLKRLPRQVLGAAVRAIPKEQRDDITCLFLNEYKEELTSLLNNLLVQNSIKAEIQNLKIDTK